MEIVDRYNWEAELTDGRIITEGGDLSKAVRFSLIPAPSLGLSRLDIVKVSMICRFVRRFFKIRFNEARDLPCPLHWVHGSREVKTESDLREIVAPQHLVRKKRLEDWNRVISISADRISLALPYQGKTKTSPSQVTSPEPGEECLHCIMTKESRIYVRYSNGAVLVAPPDYELYL